MKLIRGLVVFVVLIGAIAVAALSFFALTFDSNHYKTQIAQLFLQQTGHELTIDGELSLSIFPNISIQMGKASIKNLAGFQPENFAAFNSADVSVKLLPLLNKELKVDTVSLNQLRLNLHRKKDGTTNWAGFQGESSSEADASDFGEAMAQMLAGLTVAGVSVTDSHIDWQDDISGQKIVLSPLTLKTGAYRADNPLMVKLSTRLKQNSPAMTLKLDGSTVLTLNKEKQRFKLADLELNTTLTGPMAKGGAIETVLSGDVSGSAKTVHIPNLKLKTNITGNMIPKGKITAFLSGKATLSLDKKYLKIAGMRLESTVTGKPLQGGKLNANIRAEAGFNMKSQLLNLTGMQGKIQLDNGPLKEGSLNAEISGNTQLNLQTSSLKIKGLNLSSRLNSSQIPGGKLNQSAKGVVNLNWAKNTGVADLSSLVIKLANLQLTGSAKIDSLMSNPSVDGKFKTNAFNLSQLLKTLGIDPPKTSKAGLLGQTQANFSLLADSDNVELSRLAIKLDDMNINGNLVIKSFSSPVVRGKLAIDRLNVDNYTSPAEANKKSTPGASALLPLAAMRNLNMDTTLSVGSMVYSKLKMSKVSVHIVAKNGIVDADPISARLYKGKYTGSIRLNTAKTTPSISMTHKLRGLRSEGILYDLFNDKLVTGAANLDAKLQTSGNSALAIKQNMRGTMDVVFRDGTIRDSNFAKKMAIAVRAFEREKTDGSGQTEVTFTKLSGDWNVKNGIFRTENMAMKAPQFTTKGKGEVNIVKDELDFKLQIAGKERKDKRNLFIPLRIYGPLNALKYQLRLDVLLKEIAKADLEREKQRIKDQAKKEERRLRKQLKDKEKEERDRLKQQVGREKQRLKNQLKDEKQRLKDQFNEEKQKLQDKIKNEVGDKLKDKLRGFF